MMKKMNVDDGVTESTEKNGFKSKKRDKEVLNFPKN